MREMIFQKGQNFNQYPAFFKRGTFVRRITEERPFSAEELARIPEKHRPALETLVARSRFVELDMPVFTKVTNRAAVIFDAADPENQRSRHPVNRVDGHGLRMPSPSRLLTPEPIASLPLFQAQFRK